MFKAFKKLIKKIIFHFYPQAQDFQAANQAIAKQLLQASKEPIDKQLKKLKTYSYGLTEKSARSRLKHYGLNEVAREKPPTWYMMLFKNFVNPFNLLLTALSIFSYFLGDANATLVILTMVAISVIMRFIQEYRSSRVSEKLKSMVSTTATVIRKEHPHGDGPQAKEIPIKYLVPGDVISLAAGDMVPADVRLLSTKDLLVSQSVLTGEALPVEKFDSIEKAAQSPNHNQENQKAETLTDTQNLCFLGTNVLNGSARALVLRTGNHTYFGSMAKSMIGYRATTSFDKGINQVSWILIQFMCFLVPTVFLLNGLTKGNWFEALLFALSIAVGLTPEMLPMIVTANLAKGAIKMSRKKVVVKKLNAIQNFGAMDILCTDKTGTLTQNRIILEKHLSLEGEDNEEVLQYAYLNSYYQTGLKNLMDVAVLDHKEILRSLDLEYAFQKIDEIPFDFNRRRMSVIVQQPSKSHLMICKGAIEEILSICGGARLNGQMVPLTSDVINKAQALVNELNDDGMRVLAVAYKDLTNATQNEYHIQDESNMILMGFLAFLDPPKQSVTEALATLQASGIGVKVLTGDCEIVTRRICKWVGLKADLVLTGADMNQMDDAKLKEAIMATTIFAKVDPLQKAKIISVLKSLGHAVGYLGDGINDAAALREADIGISVDTAVDIAKESADIILLEKSLNVLGEGVIEGRKTFANINKYIKMAASSNFGNVFSVLGASAILPFLPMKPIQILTQNLLYDISQIAIPFDNVDKEYIGKPRKWNAKDLARFMVYIGPISSIFDYVTFALLWFVFLANSVEHQALFQSGWFIEGLLSQTLIVHMIRTEKIPFIESWPSWPLLFSTLGIMAIGIYIPYSFVGKATGMVSLPLSFFPWLAAILLSYCLLTQGIKFWYIRRFQKWL